MNTHSRTPVMNKRRGGTFPQSSKNVRSAPAEYWCADVEFDHPERWGFDVIIRDKFDWLIEDLKITKELQFSTQIGPVPDFKVVKIYKSDKKNKSHRWDGLVKQINGGQHD